MFSSCLSQHPHMYSTWQAIEAFAATHAPKEDFIKLFLRKAVHNGTFGS
jgi:hypothetical protein